VLGIARKRLSGKVYFEKEPSGLDWVSKGHTAVLEALGTSCYFAPKIDEFVKSLILLAPQAILGFMTRLAKLQELGLTPSNSLQFLTPDAS